MKYSSVILALFLFSSLLFTFSYAQIIASINGANDTARASKIVEGVQVARNWLASQLCTAPYFQGAYPGPDDYSTNQNWGGFLCSQWGGPAGTLANCTYYYQNVHTNESLETNPTNFPGLMKSTHIGYNLNNYQFNLTRDALVQAIYVVSQSSQAFATAASNDLETLRSSIVGTNNPPACPTPKATISWKVPTTAGTTTVKPGDYVVWTWADAFQHSVNALSSASNFQFVGFGGGDKTFATGTSCTASGNPCPLLPAGGNSFSYAYQFNTPCTTINYDCLIHGTQMSGTISVLNVNGTTCGTSTTTGYVVATTTGGSISPVATPGGGGSASTLATWISEVSTKLMEIF